MRLDKSVSRFSSLFKHDLVGKPLHTFADAAVPVRIMLQGDDGV
ncbi:hypothetical protein X566_10440 [Afipia sp. P52-10]|nr:hypothetical protein X566_10440 [Afipia sp. P52-10]